MQSWVTRKLCPSLVSVLTVLALLFGVGAISVGTATTASAATTTAANFSYPWKDAPCALSGSTSGTGYWCSDYDWGLTTRPSGDTYATKVDGYYVYDQWGAGFRNCNGYVAWQLAQYGVPSADITNMGNGGDWYTKAQAKNLSTGITPKLGAAAVKPATYDSKGNLTDPGHVALVTGITYNTDGSLNTITVQEYNHDEAGNGDIWTGPPADRGFSEYVYFASYMTNPPSYITGSSSGPTPPPPTGGNLHNYYVGSGGWTAADASSEAHVNMVGTPAIDPNGGGVFARGADNHLYQLYVSNGQWTSFDITNASGGVQIAGDPVIGPGSILARDTHGHLRQFYVSNGSWTAFDITAASGSPSIQADPGYSASNGILAIDTNGDLRQYYVANGIWTAFNVSAAIPGGVPVTGTPAVNGGIFARGTNNDLCQFYVLNGRWVVTDVTLAVGIVHIQGDPVNDPSGGVWAIDTNNHLRQFYVSNGSWFAADVSSAANQNVVGTPAIDPGGSGVYARSSDGHIFQFYVNSNAWTAFDITNATGGTTITGTPVINASGLWAI